MSSLNVLARSGTIHPGPGINAHLILAMQNDTQMS
jgi:hypothetical protein